MTSGGEQSGFRRVTKSALGLLKKVLHEPDRLFVQMGRMKPVGCEVITLGQVVKDSEGEVWDVRMLRASGPVQALLGWELEAEGILLSRLTGLVRPPNLNSIRNVFEKQSPVSVSELIRKTGRHVRIELIPFGKDGYVGAYIYDTTEERRKEKDLLARERGNNLLLRVLETLRACASGKEALEGLVAVLQEKWGADCVWLGACRDKTDTYSLEAVKFAADEVPDLAQLKKLTGSLRSLGEKCLLRKTAVIGTLEDSDESLAGMQNGMSEYGFQSVLADAVSLGQDMGLICLFSKEANAWGSVEAAMLRMISGSLTRALENIEAGEERRRGVVELQRSEDRFRSLFESAPVAYLSLDSAGGITSMNAACRKALGLETAGDRRLSFLEFVQPRSRDHVALVYEDLAKKGGARSFELPMRRRDGTNLAIVVQVSVELGHDGSFRQAHCVLFDITERKDFESALRVSEERLTHAFEIANDAIWDLNLRTGAVYLSHRYHAMLGFTPGEFPGDMDHWRALIHQDDYPEAYSVLQEFLAGSKVEFSHEHRMRTRSGDWRWILCRGRAIEFDEKGRKLRVLGINADITQRKRAEEALSESAQRYRGYIQASPLAILGVDGDGAILEANPAALSLLEAKEEELKGQVFLARIEGGSQEAARRILRQIGLSGRGEGELKCKRRNGVVLQLQVHGANVSTGKNLLFLQDITSRRRAEQLLQAREAMLESVLHTAMDGFWVVDHEGRLLEVNESYSRLLGYSNQELLRMRISDVEVLENAEAVVDHIARIQRMGQDRWETKHRCKDGRVLDMEINASFIPNDGGRVVAFMQNVTDRKEADNALRLSQRRLSLIIEGSALAAWDWDMRNDRVVFNAYWAKLFGYGNAELEIPGEAARALIHPDDKQVYDRAMQAHLRGELSHFDCEFRFKTREDAWLWVQDKGQVIARDAAGKPLRATGTQRDVTARHRAEEKVRQQAALLDQTSDIVLACDPEGMILYCNRTAKEQLELASSVIEGRLLLDVLQDMNPAPDAAFLARVVSQGFWKGELGFNAGYRHGRIWDSHWLLVQGQDGMGDQLLIVCSDVTDRRLLEARFLRAQRMESIGSLASGVAHDLNNILLPISLAANMLRTETDEVQKKSLFGMLDQSAQRGAEIVKQLLTFGRGLDGRHVELQPRMLIFEMGKIIRETFPKNITLDCVLSEDLWTVEADPTQMHQVLLNLCVNARDAMPEGGKLSLSGENVLFDEHYVAMNPDAEAGPYVVLQIGDTGIGIPPENMEKLFDPFFTTKEPGKGTGLGLSTVHGIVKSHGGFVQVRSAPGQGSLFKVYLRAIPAPMPVHEEAGDRLLARANGELILVVDDEEAVRESLRHMLEMQGYRVIVASDGRQGMVCFVQQQAHIRAVVTDIMMPVMDGAELIRAIRRLAPNLPVIAMSGLPEKEASAQKLDAKADEFLAKPFLTDQLLGLLQKCLGLELPAESSLERLIMSSGIDNHRK